jgi:hypothetical protein
MKRAAYVVNWVAFVLYSVCVVLWFVRGLPSIRYLLVVAAIFGFTLVAFHTTSLWPLRIVAAVLNGVLALLVIVMIATGIDFTVGMGAFLTTGAILVMFVVPAALNAVAMLRHVRERNSVVPVATPK